MFFEFLTFRRMITPLIIQIIFWIGILFILISGFGMIFSGCSSSPPPQVQTPFGSVSQSSSSGGGFTAFMGLVVLIVGPLILRVYCELLIVIFKILSELVAIRNSLGGQPPEPHGFPVEPIPPRMPPV